MREREKKKMRGTEKEKKDSNFKIRIHKEIEAKKQ